MGRLPDRKVTSYASARPSFEALFQEHFAGVIAAVQRFGVAARNAEDVAQDVFVAVFKALDRYDPARPLRPWLKAITYRIARDHLELSRRRERLTQMGQVDHMESTADPAQHLFDRQANEILREVLQALEASHRTIFLMAVVDQLTQLQISEALGIPESTVQSRLRRAREDFEKAVQRKRLTEGHRLGGGQVPLALCSPAALTEASRRDPDISAEVRDRVWRRVMVRVHLPSGTVGRRPHGIGQLFAISIVACSLLDNHTFPDRYGAYVKTPAPAAALDVTPLPPAAVTTSSTIVAVSPPAPAPAVPSSTSGASPENAFHGGIKLLSLARSVLALGQPIVALLYLKRHTIEHPESQVAMRNTLLAETMAQCKLQAAPRGWNEQ